MGHYASEMDPHWGEPPIYEQRFAEVEDELVQAIARSLFFGFNNAGHLDSTNAGIGINAARAIDALVDKRLGSPGKRRLDMIL